MRVRSMDNCPILASVSRCHVILFDCLKQVLLFVFGLYLNLSNKIVKIAFQLSFHPTSFLLIVCLRILLLSHSCLRY